MRCLAHFAVDNDLVYVATDLTGTKTQFLPFNQGWDGGAGNPPCKVGYATSYLWQAQTKTTYRSIVPFCE